MFVRSLFVTLALASSAAAQSVEVQMMLTAADHMNHRPPSLKAEDLTIAGATVTGLVPFDASGRDLELFLVIDDAANYDPGRRLQELKGFVASQPAQVAVGIAYIHDGALQIAQKPTTDHQLAVRAIRAPAGSKYTSPYCGLSSLIGSWSTSAARREIVVVTAGMDETTRGTVCVNAETAIADAERAGVPVFALYNPVSGYASEKWETVDAGIVELAHVSYETGGEAYFTGHTPAESFAPFLADIAEHFTHQYLVKIRMPAGPEGGFQSVPMLSGGPDRELMKPERVWVPAAPR